MLRLTWISLSFVLFFSLKKLEFDNYEVDQVVGRKKIRSLATSCFNDKLVFWQLLGASFWSIWFVGLFGRGLSFLSIGQYHFIFFLLSRDLLVFCVFTQFVSKKVFAGKFGLLCNSLHWNIAGSFFFRQLYFEGSKVTRFFSKCFFTAPFSSVQYDLFRS